MSDCGVGAGAEGRRRRVVRKEWLVSCRDSAGRRRDIVVFIDRGRVVLVAPPGETAVLAPLEVGKLRAALRDAVLEAERS
jgi:hypothetical protein